LYYLNQKVGGSPTVCEALNAQELIGHVTEMKLYLLISNPNMVQFYNGIICFAWVQAPSLLSHLPISHALRHQGFDKKCTEANAAHAAHATKHSSPVGFIQSWMVRADRLLLQILQGYKWSVGHKI
jgi:hypothetical protein